MTESGRIEGVTISPLQTISDERGFVRHFMKRVDLGFLSFGEVYFSAVYPGALKAWHLHRVSHLNYVCVTGAAYVGLYDDRDGSPTRGNGMKVFLSDDDMNYKLLTIPPFVWNGYRSPPSMRKVTVIANLMTEQSHSEDEIVRKSPKEVSFDFDWGEYRVAG